MLNISIICIGKKNIANSDLLTNTDPMTVTIIAMIICLYDLRAINPPKTLAAMINALT